MRLLASDASDANEIETYENAVIVIPVMVIDAASEVLLVGFFREGRQRTIESTIYSLLDNTFNIPTRSVQRTSSPVSLLDICCFAIDLVSVPISLCEVGFWSG